MDIFVGNIDRAMTSEQLHALFEPFGSISSAEVYTIGEADAFGYVVMEDATEGQAAIDHLGGTTHQGKLLAVVECMD